MPRRHRRSRLAWEFAELTFAGGAGPKKFTQSRRAAEFSIVMANCGTVGMDFRRAFLSAEHDGHRRMARQQSHPSRVASAQAVRVSLRLYVFT